MTAPFTSERVRPWTLHKMMTLWDPGSPGRRFLVKRWFPWFRRSEFATLSECLKAYTSTKAYANLASQSASLKRDIEQFRKDLADPFFGEAAQMTMGDDVPGDPIILEIRAQ